MAPTVPVRNRDAGAGYNANLGGKLTSRQTTNDGLYRPAQYPPENQWQYQAGNSLFGAGQGIPQKGSPSYTPKPIPYQQNQQGEYFSPPQPTENPNGNYLSNGKGTGQHGDPPGLSGNGAYQHGSSPQSHQQQTQENPPVLPYNNGGNYGSNAAAQGQPASNAGVSNTGDGSYPNQWNPDVPAASKPTLATDTMLPTGTIESASPTISPTASSTASPTSSPTPAHNQAGSYQTGVVVLSAGLGVVLVGMVFAGWLHKRRRQQKSLPNPQDPQNPPKPSKGVPQTFQSVMASTKGAIFPSKSTQRPPENPSPAPSTDMVVPSKRGSKSSSKNAAPSPEIKSSSTEVIVSPRRESVSSIKNMSFTKNETQVTTNDAQSTKSDPSSKKSDSPSAKERVSNMYTSVIGAAVGTGAAALGAVRKLKPAPKKDQGNLSNDIAQTNDQHNNSAPRDLGQEEKGDMNGSTATLVASPTEIFVRESSPTLRRVPSGEPQVEHAELADRKKRASTIPEHDEEQPPDKDTHETGDSAAEPGVKPTRNKSKPKLVGNAFASSHNLQSIAEAPSSNNTYLVEIDHITSRTGELNIREGQTITIRQAFDDGWVSIFR